MIILAIIILIINIAVVYKVSLFDLSSTKHSLCSVGMNLTILISTAWALNQLM